MEQMKRIKLNVFVFTDWISTDRYNVCQAAHFIQPKRAKGVLV